jgi:hypothetical protein
MATSRRSAVGDSRHTDEEACGRSKIGLFHVLYLSKYMFILRNSLNFELIRIFCRAKVGSRDGRSVPCAMRL